MSVQTSRSALRLSFFGIVLMLAGAGCSKCARPSTPATGIERQVPKTGQVLVVVPDLAALGQKLRILERLQLATFLAQLQGAGSAEQLVTSVMNQIGIDLRSREAMEKAGLAPDKGLALVVRQDGSVYSVVAVKDAGAFEKTLAQLAKSRLGAGSTRKEAGATLFARDEKATAVFAMIVKDGFAFVAQGPDVASLTKAANLTEAESLAASEELKAGLGRLPKERDLFAFVPTSRVFGGPKDAPTPPATLTFSLTEKGLVLRSDALARDRPELLAALESKGKPALLGYLPGDAFLFARFGGDPVALDQLWPHVVGQNVARAVKKSGFDVKAQLLENLEPGVVLGVSLAPNVPIGAGLPQLDVRRTNPFRYVHLAAVSEVKDKAKAKTTFDALPPVAQGFGATLTPSTRAEVPVLLASWSQGEGAHLGLSEKHLVMAAPEARLVELLERLKSGPAKTPAKPDLAGVFDQNAVALVLDLERLAKSIEELPTSAWGIGGFVIRDTALRWLAAMGDLKAVVMAASAKDGAIQSELSLRIAPKPEAKPK